MNADKAIVIFGVGVILFYLSVIGFGLWVIIKLLSFWGVI